VHDGRNGDPVGGSSVDRNGHHIGCKNDRGHPLCSRLSRQALSNGRLRRCVKRETREQPFLPRTSPFEDDRTVESVEGQLYNSFSLNVLTRRNRARLTRHTTCLYPAASSSGSGG